MLKHFRIFSRSQKITLEIGDRILVNIASDLLLLDVAVVVEGRRPLTAGEVPSGKDQEEGSTGALHLADQALGQFWYGH